MCRILVPVVPPHRIWLITNPWKLSVGFGIFTTLLEIWKKPFRQIKRISKWKCLIWIDNSLDNCIWKMVAFQHLYCLRNMKWGIFSIMKAHTIRDIFSKETWKADKTLNFLWWSQFYLLYFMTHLLKTQLFAKTQLAGSGKFGGGCFFPPRRQAHQCDTLWARIQKSRLHHLCVWARERQLL